MIKYVIYGRKATEQNWFAYGEPMFWNEKENDWLPLTNATIYEEEETDVRKLPPNGIWVELPEL